MLCMIPIEVKDGEVASLQLLVFRPPTARRETGVRLPLYSRQFQGLTIRLLAGLLRT